MRHPDKHLVSVLNDSSAWFGPERCDESYTTVLGLFVGTVDSLWLVPLGLARSELYDPLCAVEAPTTNDLRPLF